MTLRKAQIRSKAVEIKEMEKLDSPTGASHRVELIERVIRLRTNPLTNKDIAMITGNSVQTIDKISRQLNKIDLYGPEMKEKAVKAAGEILEEGTEKAKMEMINKIYPDKAVAPQAPTALSININAKDLDFKNDKDYVDMDKF